MAPASTRQPTLWRTCRVLANRVRLAVLLRLFQQPDQTVSAVALQVGRPLALTSLYLRALEARGLLSVRRRGRWVTYRPGATTGPNAAAGLVAALRTDCQTDPATVERLFRLATAFTHPRRIEIFRALQTGPQTLGQLRETTGISSWALLRHLRKLETRGFVVRDRGRYQVEKPADQFGRELARLATS